MSNIKTTRLWMVRKRLGRGQKQIAKLLARSIPQISRYETEQRIPSLKTALKLSIIYKLPIRLLFRDYYDECHSEINSRIKSLKHRATNIDITDPTDYCSYIEMMKTPFMTDVDKRKVQRHVLELMKERTTRILDH